MITRADRLRAALRGEIVDRPPVSFWTHFPGTDLDPAELARATQDFAWALDIDLVKSMPNGLYCVEDWGVAADYSAIAAGGVARVVHSPIRVPEDWAAITRLDVTQGALGRELDHLARLCATLGPDWPVLATVFSPLTIAKKLEEHRVLAHAATHPALLHQALACIAATMADFAARAVALGCAGIFFAVQDATPQTGTDAYLSLGEPYDRIVLEGASAGWLNTIHMHGDAILFDLLKDYPVHCLNWHIGETAPSIAAYRAAGGARPILGGLRRMALTARDWDAVQADIAAAREAQSGRGIIYGPACVIRHPVDRDFLRRVIAGIRGEA